MSNLLLKGDCTKLLPVIPSNSVGLVICDMPYGKHTNCNWDIRIDMDLVWPELWRVLRNDRAVLLFGGEPFSTYLRGSAIEKYRYDWYWNKGNAGNFVQAKKMPLKTIEVVSVFSFSRIPVYFPIMEEKEKPRKTGSQSSYHMDMKVRDDYAGRLLTHSYPNTSLKFAKVMGKNVIHPTEKPVALLEYLIKTYSIEGDIVLDFTFGSGSCCIAAMNTGRSFIGIEKDEEYFELATERIEKHKLDSFLHPENIISHDFIHFENQLQKPLRERRQLERGLFRRGFVA